MGKTKQLIGTAACAVLLLTALLMLSLPPLKIAL
jgi:hypothetical protein